ncbi:YbjN domain-containing protein [Micromonospora sp. PLK6-60]|uniref:YbjN domain-containing protein n=1 Tax=Micromonospora sp. PLK6-60 TaxID=2873383 RepID=UPI001CA64EB1|nr:YbjN domain-containing protein [Micromonospora sp. PLK6-60]MBY8873630.1 YbjN domain-containing protein [Micromonospora sp. PLK6-60]
MTADHPSAPPAAPAGTPPEPHESILLDEPSTADLRAKVTEAWREFARSLAEQLRELPAGAHLELTLDPTASGTGDAVYSTSVDVGEQGRLSARAVGNATLPAGYRLDRAAVADMIALGWSPPGVVPGSGEDFGLDCSVAEVGRLAPVLTRTLRDVYGAPHPAFLVYLVHDGQGESLPLRPLGTARSEFGPDRDVEADLDEALAAAASAKEVDTEVLDLAERVRTVVSTMLKSKSDQIQVDSDGDINIRAGSAMVFVRVRDNPPLVDVFSPVLTEVEPTERLYVKLSELTNRMPIGRLYCADDTVWASIPVFGRNFQATHLMLAVQVMTGLADELDDRLHGEFGGKRFFGEGDKPARAIEGEHRTGMYL